MAVYFIRNGNYIKIGVSVDPWKRLASLQTGNPELLEMLAIMPGGNDLEVGLHRAFNQYMKQGEWFLSNDNLLSFIETIKATFPEFQARLVDKTYDSSIDYIIATTGYESLAKTESRFMELGESTTFRITHKGHYRNPSPTPHYFWQRMNFYDGGYWQAYDTGEWLVLTANGLYYEFVDMQHVTITRTGDIHEGNHPSMSSIQYSLEQAMNTSLKEAIYNRRNNNNWLGVYNNEQHGIVIAVKKQPDDQSVHLDVPDEVINYWRQYEYKSPLPDGVSIEG